MTKDEALRLALEALEAKDGWGSSIREAKERAITAIKAALEAKDEPVAWSEEIIDDLDALYNSEMIKENDSGDALIRLDAAVCVVEEVAQKHTTPPQRKPLTEIALLGAYEAEQKGRWGDHVRGLRAIEAAHGIKDNT